MQSNHHDRGHAGGSASWAGPRRRLTLMPPLLLYSHIANELLAPFFASFIILYGVFFLVRLIPLLEVVLSLQIGLADFIRLSAYIFPHMLLYIIPMASMAGVIIGFTRLTNDREILALKSCGVSLRQMLPPVILFAAAITSLTALFSIRLIPAGDLAFQQLMFTLAKERIDKGLKEHEFTEALGDIVVYVDRIDDQKRWHGVWVSDMRGRKQPLITVAQSGSMSTESERMLVTIVLEDGTLHNAEGADNQVVHFKRYQLQISLRPPTQVGNENLATQSRGAMSQEQLLAAAAGQQAGSKSANVFLSEYHQRLILPASCFILSLLGLPLGLQAGPGRQAIGIPLGLAAFIAYYLTFTMVRVLAEDGKLPLVAGMWLPNLLLFGLTVLVFRQVNRERPLLPEALQNLLAALGGRLLLRPARRFLHLVRSRFAAPASPEADQSASARSIPAGKRLIHADPATGICHLPDCPGHNDPDCRITFKNIEIAQQAGFQPCPYCTSLLKEDDRRPMSPS